MYRALLRRLAGGPLVPIVAPVVIFAEALTGRRALVPGDGTQAFLPWFTAAGRAWRAGELPAWNPLAFSGSPLLAISQPGVFYPPNWLHVVVPPVMAMNIVLVAQFVVAGVGAWLLARHLTGDAAGATVAGVAFGLCAFFFAHVSHASMIASAAWLPFVLYGYERLRERWSPRFVLLGGGALALSFLAGHSNLAFVVLFALGAYAAGVAVLVPRPERGRALAALVVVVAAGLGLSAAQLFPTARFLPLSVREEGLSYAEAMSYSLPRSHLPLLVFPYLFGNSAADGPFAPSYTGRWMLPELSGYPGMAALALAAAGATAARRDRRLLALAVAGTLAGLLALGPGTPLSRLVYRFPVYGQFRGWARYLMVVDLAVAVFAAFGVRQLRSPDPKARRAALTGAAVAVAGVVVLGVLVPRLEALRPFFPPGGVRPASVALPAGAALLGLGCAAALARRLPGAAALTAALVVLDAASFGLFCAWRGTSSVADVAAARDSRSTFWGGVEDRPGGLDRYLFIGVDTNSIAADFTGATDYKGLASANGSDPLAPADYLDALGMDYWGALGKPERVWQPDSRVLDVLRVTTVLVDPPSSPPGPPPGSPLAAGVPVPGSRLVRYTYDPAVPEAFLVGRAEVRSRPAVLAALRGADPFDPGALGLLEQACPGCPTEGASGPAGKARVESSTDNSVRLEVTAERPALAVVSQAWLPGWRASVDGRTAPVVRVDGLVQGVPVPGGRHSVTLRYGAPGAREGLVVSLAVLAGLLGWAAVNRKRAPSGPRPRDVIAGRDVPAAA